MAKPWDNLLLKLEALEEGGCKPSNETADEAMGLKGSKKK